MINIPFLTTRGLGDEWVEVEAPRGWRLSSTRRNELADEIVRQTDQAATLVVYDEDDNVLGRTELPFPRIANGQAIWEQIEIIIEQAGTAARLSLFTELGLIFNTPFVRTGDPHPPGRFLQLDHLFFLRDMRLVLPQLILDAGGSLELEVDDWDDDTLWGNE